jgi:hypothetical protein
VTEANVRERADATAGISRSTGWRSTQKLDYLTVDARAKVERAFLLGAPCARRPDAQVRRALHHPSGRGGRHPRRDADGCRDLCAAILHDTLEDTPLQQRNRCRVRRIDVAELVDGVTKLDKVQFRRSPGSAPRVSAR